MSQPIKTFPPRGHGQRTLIWPVLVFWTLCVVGGAGFLAYDDGLAKGLGDLYLMPWAVLTAIVLLAPSVYLFYRGEFDVFHPLVYGVWSYLFPAFVIGAVILSLGWTDPYFLSFIEDPRYNLPLSLVYVSIGFMGLTAGYYLPAGRFLAEKLDSLAPRITWKVSSLWLPGLALIFIGVAVNIVGFLQGLFGYQRVDEIGVFDGTVVYLSTFYIAGFILLWLYVFHSKMRAGAFYIVIGLLLALIPVRMAFMGSRSSLMMSVIPIAFAFWHSGRRLKWQHALVFGSVLAVAVFVGVVYGTTFRNIKGSEARMDAGDYVGQIGATADYLSKVDGSELVTETARTLSARIENLSSLGVVVANHEKLAPFEESYGLRNNIRNDLLTAFVPRFLWADKPITSDPRAYSELYFNYGDNSFAITPFGDLLRNFGVIGIPLGMMLLGVYLRILYSFLIGTERPAIWKTMAYYPLLTVVTYEAFYAVIFPSALRVAVIIAICIALANFLAVRGGRGALSPV